MNISDFRSKYPQYKDVPDPDLASALHQKYYADVPFEDFSKAFVGEKSATALDYGKGFAAGTAGLVEAGGRLANTLGRQTGFSDIGQDPQRAGTRAREAITESMTPAGKAAVENPVFQDDASLGPTPLQSLTMGVAMSLPSMLASIPLGAGGAAASRLLSAGGLESLKRLGGAPAWIAERLPTGAGYAGAEGGIAALQNAAQTEADILKLPFEKLEQSPTFQQFVQGGGTPDQARTALARYAADQVARQTFVSTAGIGLVTGGGALGAAHRQIANRTKDGVLKSIFKGAGAEALQEAPQSGAEQYIESQARKDYLEPGLDPLKGVVSAALSGGAIGGVTGGVMGGAGGAISRARGVEPAIPAIESPPAQTPPSPAQDVAQAAIAVLQAPSIDEAIAAAQTAVEPSRAMHPEKGVLAAPEPTAMELAFQKAGFPRETSPESPGFVPPALAAPPTDVITDVTAMSDVALDLAGRLTRSEERRAEIQTEQQRRVDLQSAAQVPEAQVAEPSQSVEAPLVEPQTVPEAVSQQSLSASIPLTGEQGPQPGGGAAALPQPQFVEPPRAPRLVEPPAQSQPTLAPPPLQSELIPAPAVASAAVPQQQPPLPAVPIPLVPPTKVDRIGGKPVKDIAAWQLKQFTQVGGAGVKALAQAELDRRDEESGAMALRDALADPNLRTSIKAFKGVIGRDDVGGKVIVDMAGADTAPGMGDVIGRTSHTGDHRWFGRPDQSLSAPAARAAIDKALAGKDLGDREQRFLNYVVENAKQMEAELAQDEALAESFADEIYTGDWSKLSAEERDAEVDRALGSAPAEVQSPAAPPAGESARAPESEARQEVPAEAEVGAQAVQSEGTATPAEDSGPAADRGIHDDAAQRRDELSLRGQQADELTAKAEAQRQAEVEQREQKNLVDREREVFALQPPSGTVTPQPLSEPKNQQELSVATPADARSGERAGVATPLETTPLSEITVRVKAVEAETGRTIVLNEKADIALKSVDEQISTAKRLLECLGS